MKKIILLLLVNCIWLAARAQESLRPSGDIVTPSPNVTAMNKFIDIPVSHYTGLPQISVPIFAIPMNQFSVPISLGYHASGLKVAEHSSWVGAGWSLNAGGSISRVIRGLPDEYALGEERGFFHNSAHFNDQGNWMNYVMNCSDNLQADGGPGMLDQIAEGILDFEPDMYYYSAPGISGKFVFNSRRTPIFLNENDTKLNHPFTGTANGQAYYPKVGAFEWSIVAPDGVSYTFKKAEYTSTLTACTPNSAEQVDVEEVQNAWYLTKMSIGGEYVEFKYVEEEVEYDEIYTQSKQVQIYDLSTIVSTGYEPQQSFCTTRKTIKTQRLDSIISSNGYIVDFIADSENRKDQAGSKALKSIVVLKNGETIAHYDLIHDYFGAQDYKLRLDGIDQLAVDGSNKKIHLEKFDYFYPGQVPKLQSYSQDYYGYFNGKYNQDLIPDWRDHAHHYNPNGADRSIDLEKTKVGTLKRMTHATGGYQEYEYELHDIADSSYRYTIKREDHIDGASIGNPITKISEEFTVDQEASMSLFLDMPILDEDLNDISGIDYGVYIERFENGDWVIQRPQMAEPTMSTALKLNEVTLGANRMILPAGKYRLRALSHGGTLDYEAIIDEYKKVDFFKIGGLRIREIKSYDHVTNTSLHDFYEYTSPTDNEEYKNSSGLVFTIPETAGYFTDYFRHDDTFASEDNPTTDLNIGPDGIPVDPSEIDEGTPQPKVRFNGSFTYINLTNNVLTFGGNVTMNIIDPNEVGVFDKFRDFQGLPNCDINTISRYLNLSSSATYPIATFSGSHIGYSTVQHYRIDQKDLEQEKVFRPAPNDWPLNAAVRESIKKNGVTEYYFINEKPEQSFEVPYVPENDLSHINGKVDSVRVYEHVDGSLVLKSKQINSYINAPTHDKTSVIGLKVMQKVFDDCLGRCSEGHFVSNYYSYVTKWHYLNKSTSIIYEDNGAFTTDVTHRYDPQLHHFSIGNSTTNSEGEMVRVDINRLSSKPALVDRQEVFVDDEQVSGEWLYYVGKLPSTYEKWNRDLTISSEAVISHNSQYKQELLRKFDGQGNLTEIIAFPDQDPDDQIHQTVIWGYGGVNMIAKLTNVSESQLDTYLDNVDWENTTINREWFKDITNKSDYEEVLIKLNDELSSDQQMQILIHDSPFGPTKIIDENGESAIYDYDAFGRLKSIVDEEGNIISYHEYHYVNQNF